MRLTDCFMELVAYVAYFLKSVNTKQPQYEQVKADIMRLISECHDKFEKSSFPQDDYDLARFAVFAWIDEVILGSSWEHKKQWQKDLLQRIYFQTTDAGEIFFDRLNTIGPHQKDVREVYFLCMEMGFTGRYCREGDEFLLDQLKISNLKLLTGSSVGIPSLEKTELFPEAYPAEIAEAATGKKGKLFSSLTLFSIGFPVLLYFGLFLIYKFILNNVGENLLGMVP